MQCKTDGKMEDVVAEDVSPPSPVVGEREDVKNTESAENFQKFMYELFENNGVINDLRAYLRGHIIGLLKSTRTGEPPPCQKHFTQRLELPYQALNILLAEYLLKLEFSYTLSVFISEIPLANMVFGFAKSLLQNYNNSNKDLQFKDEDVWSILHYLGVKCDSEHAANIVEMYRGEKQPPLLLCMLKSMPLYPDRNSSSQESLSSSIRSTDSPSHHPTTHRCKHAVFCKTCRRKMQRFKEKYTKKKRTLANHTKESTPPNDAENLMKNMDIIEKNLIDEMFQQLKSVYDKEMQMVKDEEEQRLKRSIATHAVQLKKKQIEMEQSFKARELELEHNVKQKKRFLWGLARLLREQHKQMARAMHDIQEETSRLTAKEDSLKSQLAEAEKILRQRGEDMREMISNELAILEGHLGSMKRERDTINKERSELEQVKHLCDNNSKTTNVEMSKEDFRSHYDLLQNEFNVLKMYLESTKLMPKCVMERSTITEAVDGGTAIDGTLNNGQDLDRSRSEDKVKAERVVNDLKKMKNVNISQLNLAEIYRERSRSSTASSEAGDADARHETRRLREENERLRTFARQQREHIDELSSQQARMAAELTAARAPLVPPTPRPRTAPATCRNTTLMLHGASSETSRGHGWRKGAGEEMSFFANAQPRIIVPGDTLPFIGVVNNRHTDSRRYLINQWRSLRHRVAPLGGAGKARAAVAASGSRNTKGRASSAGPSARIPAEEHHNNHPNAEATSDVSNKPSCESNEPQSMEKAPKEQEKSSQTLLREAKERLLKSKDENSTCRPTERDENPNTVIRDAKLRLRRLEIEAEAVEKSYMDFRKKQDALRAERNAAIVEKRGENFTGKEIDLKRDKKSYESERNLGVESTSRYIPPMAAFEQIIEDIEEYHAKYDISMTHFKNKNTTPIKEKPIPTAYSYEAPLKTKRMQNYLETPLPEFRRHYHSEKKAGSNENLENRPVTSRNSGYESPQRKSNHKPTNDSPPSPSTRNRRVSSETRKSKSPSPRSEKRDISPSLTPERKHSPRSQKPKYGTKAIRNELFRQAKQTKAKELEILKQNISKIYNLSQKTMADNIEGFNENVQDVKWTIDKERKAIIDDTITEASRDEIASDAGSEEPSYENKNSLRIELQSVSQVNDVKISDSQPQDLLLVIESSIVYAERSDTEFQCKASSNQTTLFVSPKKSVPGIPEIASPVHSNPGEKSIKLGGDDTFHAIYEAEPTEDLSCSQMLENSKDALVPFLSDPGDDQDYADDVSAEADNCNSGRYETDQEPSPISLPKTSEEENFWDS